MVVLCVCRKLLVQNAQANSDSGLNITYLFPVLTNIRLRNYEGDTQSPNLEVTQPKGCVAFFKPLFFPNLVAATINKNYMIGTKIAILPAPNFLKSCFLLFMEVLLFVLLSNFMQ